MAFVISHGNRYEQFYCYYCGCKFYEEKKNCDVITMHHINYFRTDCPECLNDCIAEKIDKE